MDPTRSRETAGMPGAISLAFSALVLLVSVSLLFLPVPDGVDERTMRGAGLIVFVVGFYATGALPEFLTTLAYFAVAVLLALAPAAVVFSGFESSALWLILGGLMIGAGVRRSGLALSLAQLLIGYLGASYARLIGGTALFSIGLVFLIPSTTGRVLVMLPIVDALASRLDLAPGSPGRNGLVLIMALGTWMPAVAVLPSNLANLVLVGAAETLYGISPSYGAYLLLHFPVLGLLKGAALVGAVLLLLPARVRARPEAAVRVAFTPRARRMAAVLAITLALWVTDGVHGIPVAWISLAAGVLCLLPGIGLVPAADFNREIDFTTILFTAGIIGVGAIAMDSGVGRALGSLLLEVLPLRPGENLLNFVVLVALSSVAGVAMTVPTVPAVVTPLAGDLADAAGLPLLTVLMTQVVGFSTVYLPYQIAPVVIACRLGGASIAAATRVLLVVAVFTLIVLVPLDFLWWRLLGYFP